MNLYPIHAGNFKLDGGAMFGVVPKVLWNDVYPADEDNLCTWALRCLLVEDGNRLILVDNGMGDKQDEKFFRRYQLSNDPNLESSFKQNGFCCDDVTDVFLTHLHFDHCGGAIQWNRERSGFEAVFKNAVYWTHKKQWEAAIHPNAREQPSFLEENLMPMMTGGKLEFVDKEGELFPNFHVRFTFGHTESHMIPRITWQGETIVFMGDLIPSSAHIPLVWNMSYDIRPLQTIKEKDYFLTNAANNGHILFFEHDVCNECCTLKQTGKAVRAHNKGSLKEVLAGG